MGKYYKTSSPTFVDFMQKLPEEMMMKAVSKTDEHIDEVYENIAEERKLLDVDGMEGDSEFINERLGIHEKELNDIALAMNKNVMNYGKYSYRVKDASRNLEKDLLRGGLGRAQDTLKEFKEYEDRIMNDSELSSERKRLLIAATKKNYGSLDYKGENDYNRISKHFITGFKDVDEEKFLATIGQGWTPDQKSWSYARAEGDYIKSGRGVTKSREEAAVENYIKESLESSGWKQEQRQKLELRQTLGEFEGDIDEEMLRLEKSLLDRGKEKLAFTQTTSSKSMTPDSSKNRRGDSRAGGFELRNNISSPATQRKTVASDNTITKSIQNKSLKGYADLEAVVTSAISGKGVAATYKDLSSQGLFPGGKSQFYDWLNQKQAEQTGYIPIDDATVVNSYNNRGQSQKVKALWMTDSKGYRIKLSQDNVAELVEQDGDSEYIYFPSTGSSTVDILKRTPNGKLADSGGDVIQTVLDDGTIETYETYEEAKLAGMESRVTTDSKKIASYQKPGNILKADANTLKEVTTSHVDNMGNISTDNSYVHSVQYTRMKKGGKELEYVMVEVYIDPKTINQNK